MATRACAARRRRTSSLGRWREERLPQQAQLGLPSKDGVAVSPVSGLNTDDASLGRLDTAQADLALVEDLKLHRLPRAASRDARSAPFVEDALYLR